MPRKELSIVVPCYNEKDNLEILFSKIISIISKYEYIKFVLVDNGSTDGSYDKIKRFTNENKSSTECLKIDKNIGYGWGISKGLEICNTEFLGWTHADLQTDLLDTIKAFELLKTKKYADMNIVKGKRINRNFFDNLFTFGMSMVSSITLGAKLDDINAQPKLFTKKFYETLQNIPKDFSLDLYLLYEARKKSVNIDYIDVDFHKRRYGVSKGGGTIFGKFKLIIRTFKYIFNLKKEYDRNNYS